MAYCTVTDINNAISEATLIQLTDDSGAGVVDTTVTAAMIAKADAFINSYLRKQVSTPISTVPVEVQEASVDLSIYYLYKRRRDVSSDDLDEGVRERFEDTRNWLKDVANGTVFIETETTINTAGRYRTNKTTSDQVYTDNLLSKY